MKFEKQDLVHPPDRLEAVQVVLGGLALDVAGLVREVGARRMDPLAPLLQHRRDGTLREPVDLQIRVELAKLVGDGHVALRMPETDRRRDVERALTPRLPPHPPARWRWRLDEVAQEQVDLDGSRAWMKWPPPSIVTSSPAVALASSTPRACGVTRPRRRGSRAPGTAPARKARAAPSRRATAPWRGRSSSLRRSPVPSRPRPRCASSSAALSRTER